MRPHVLISDIGMPGKDGYALIREVRRSSEHKRLPAIALRRSAGMPVTALSVRMGVPIAPYATGAVFAMSDNPAA